MLGSTPALGHANEMAPQEPDYSAPDPNLKLCEQWIGVWKVGADSEGNWLRVKKRGNRYIVSYREKDQIAWSHEKINASADPGSRIFNGGSYADNTCSLNLPGGLLVKVTPGARYLATSSGGNGLPFETKTAKTGYLLYELRDYYANGLDMHPVKSGTD
jgi:hypothetical protein